MNDEYNARVEDITVIGGVEIDIEVRGDEARAETALIELKDHLGWIAEAYDQETPPEQLDDRAWGNTPPMSVDWAGVFGDEDD